MIFLQLSGLKVFLNSCYWREAAKGYSIVLRNVISARTRACVDYLGDAAGASFRICREYSAVFKQRARAEWNGSFVPTMFPLISIVQIVSTWSRLIGLFARKVLVYEPFLGVTLCVFDHFYL